MSGADDIQADADRESLSILERSLPAVTPPPDMFDRILSEIQPQATVVPLEPRRTRRRLSMPVAGAAVAVAAAVLITFIVLAGDDGPGAPDGRAAITGKSDPTVSGEAVLYRSSADDGTVRISLRAVPAAPSGHHYEVWVLRREANGQMEAVGTFTPTSRDVELDLRLPGPGDYAAVDISVEENGGPPGHSETSLAGGTFS